jgi:hypothetical protein
VTGWSASNNSSQPARLAAAGPLPRTTPLLAHLVVPHGDDMVNDEVFYVSGHDEHRNSWDSNPHAPMTITRSDSRDRQSEILGELHPHDDGGFARVLGQWTRLVPYTPDPPPAADLLEQETRPTRLPAR